MVPKAPWRYAVPFSNPTSGEQRTIVVTLSDLERNDALRQREPGPGGYNGLVVRGYALSRACPLADAGFEPIVDKIEFVTVH